MEELREHIKGKPKPKKEVQEQSTEKEAEVGL